MKDFIGDSQIAFELRQSLLFFRRAGFLIAQLSVFNANCRHAVGNLSVGLFSCGLLGRQCSASFQRRRFVAIAPHEFEILFLLQQSQDLLRFGQAAF